MCDYFIHKILQIKINNFRYPVQFVLSTDVGVFKKPPEKIGNRSPCEKKLKKFYEDQLKSDFEPFLIYENNNFITENYKEEYYKKIVKILFDYDFSEEEIGYEWSKIEYICINELREENAITNIINK